ncbi:protein phosphatase 1 regulatory subunit 26 [Hyla sarda]|uniref:protein phosphatase 1 regulatory subunit 26 n=1 Tax=Hyla sarda TaxID=327740 RepID=UPI0024C2D59F|nr:protein phosphatase 1 regulatory subunit 26 [Hyla sarda]
MRPSRSCEACTRRHGNTGVGRTGARAHVSTFPRTCALPPCCAVAVERCGLGYRCWRLRDGERARPPCGPGAGAAREDVRSSAFSPTARMFLLNAPPLAAFPTQWTPFGCSTAPCCVPSAVADIPVAADVEGAADSPQSDASSLTVNLEYERIMQKNRKGELHIDRGLKPGPALFRAHAREKAALIVPAHFRDIKEEGSDFEALALDSDSDDSVDRGIEEAIQEYLKNRGSAAPSSCVPAAKSPNTSAENDGDQVKAAQSSAPARRSPIKMVTSPKVCESLPMQTLSRCSSPDSVGSDDSFELSIKEEIEQFLIEKKLQNNPSESGAGKKQASHSAAKLKPKPIKAVEKASPKQGPKGPTVKTASESLNLLPKNVKPKAESGKSNFRLKLAPSPTKPTISRQLPLPSAQCADLSDSSSDDGIEEAIQLYQLEKSRLEGNLSSATRTFPEKDGKSTTNATSDVIPCQIKNSPEPQKKTDYRKRKLASLKPAASQDCTSKRALHSADEPGLKYQPEVAALRRTETATELMCAEAILDISKAILPSQPERSVAVLQDKPSARPPSPCASDSSVDSNDSIEQEIRTFLAQKAQAESLCTTSAKQSPKEQRSEPPKQLPLPSTKAIGTCKGKVNDSKVVVKDSPGKAIESLNVECSPVHSSLPFGQHLKGKAVEPCPDDSSNKPHCQAENAKHHIIQAMESLESSPGISGGRRKSYIKVRSNYSGDKSSSLDSDEDLDSAIKDLLRSKRKCKKRPKDGRPQCKKKVRFGETTTRPLEAAGGTEQKDCCPKLLVVKSCLVTNNPKDISFKKSKTSLKIKEEKKIPLGSAESSSVTKPVESKPACASDKSVNISSSALPDPQDSSSVDSDDSIEQEIRKFLADRARESAELSSSQRTAAHAILPIAIKTEPAPALIASPAPIKKEPGVLSSSVTETILQKVREKNRTAATVTQPTIIQRVYGYKDNLSSVARLQRPPMGIAKAAAPVRSVIVPRECIARPAEKKLPMAPDRVVVKTGVNSSQGNIPISGNFVAGLKYISGTEQQLLLNVGKTGATRLATDFYNPAGTIAQLGNCQAMQKKTLILEQPKVVQAPAFSLGTPMVRPALYVVTTKVVQETSASLCLPINATTYDTGLNLMSIQYCPSQVAPHPSACTAPFTFQQARNSETMVITPGKAGEIPTLLTKARARETTSGLLDGESRCPNVTPRAAENIEPGASMVQKEKVPIIDPGWSVPLYISLSPEGICKRQHLRRRAEQVIAQMLKARTPYTRVRP